MSRSATAPSFRPVADHGLLVSFGRVADDATSAAVLALDRALAAAPPTGFRESVPALVNLLVSFDPLVADHASIRAQVLEALRTAVDEARTGRVREVEVCYEAEVAPDLRSVADATGLSVDEVIAGHLGGDYRVRMYGFAPGYAYLSGTPARIQVPRKPAAVRDVPHGSVLVAGPQCLVTTLTMPTGWSAIGRSATRILLGGRGVGVGGNGQDDGAGSGRIDGHDGDRRPFLFDVGDRVRFRRIGLDRLHREERASPSRASPQG